TGKVQMVERGKMSSHQVLDVDVITYAGTVTGRVVVAKYLQLLAQASRHLGHKRHQIIGRAQRHFSEQTTRMSCNGVEVAKHSDIQLAGLRKTLQNLLTLQFGQSIYCLRPQRRHLVQRL